MTKAEIYKTTCETISESLDWGACTNGTEYFYFIDGIVTLMEELIEAEDRKINMENVWEKKIYSC